MHPIEMLLRAVNDGRLLGADTFDGIASEEILAKRDSPEFEREWLRLFEKVKDTNLNQEQHAALRQLRGSAFKAAFRYTADTDLSGTFRTTSNSLPKEWPPGRKIAFSTHCSNVHHRENP